MEWLAFATMLRKPSLPSVYPIGAKAEANRLPIGLPGFSSLPHEAQTIFAQALVEQRPINIQQSERTYRLLRWLLTSLDHRTIATWQDSACLDLHALALIVQNKGSDLATLWRSEYLSQSFNSVVTQGALALEFGVPHVVAYFEETWFVTDQRIGHHFVADMGILSVYVKLLHALPFKPPAWPSVYMDAIAKDTDTDMHVRYWSTWNEHERLLLLQQGAKQKSYWDALPWEWSLPIPQRATWLVNALPDALNIERLRTLFAMVLPEHQAYLDLVTGDLHEQRHLLTTLCHSHQQPLALPYPPPLE